MSGDAFEAVVQVGSEETRYLRCGRGPAVLAVTADPDERLRLVELLRSHYRVIAPVPPPFQATSSDPGAGMADWLRGVIEGLGLAAPHVLLSGTLAGLAGVSAGDAGESD